MNWVSAEDAISVITSGDHLFIHSIAAAPQALITALMRRTDELRDVEIYHIHTEGPAPYAAPAYADSFHTNALFVGANVRAAAAPNEPDYIPVFLSEAPALFRTGMLPLDIALIQVSPPDQHGFCSLGVSVDFHGPLSRAPALSSRRSTRRCRVRMAMA